MPINDKTKQPGRADKKEKFIRHNWKIKARNCRVIEEGVQNRIMKTKDAIEYAIGLGLDLVEVGYDKVSDTAIAKICEYGKFVYDMKQKEKQAKKQARANLVEIKTVQFSLTIDDADRMRMVERAKAFLKDGDKVKISLRFRGRREMNCVDRAKDVIKGVLNELEGLAKLDSAPQMGGRELTCVVRPA